MVGPHTEPVPCAGVDPHLAPILIERASDLLDVLLPQREILIPDREAGWYPDASDLVGDVVQHARVARERGVDEWARRLCPIACGGGGEAVSEVHGVFPAPAEPGGADGEVAAFVLANGGEEGCHDGPGFGEGVVEAEGDDGVERPKEVVPKL